MRFEDHLEATRRDDGSFDLAAAVEARTEDIMSSGEEIESLARKAAQQERRRYEDAETSRLRKQFMQPALSPDLELEIKVPLGDDTMVELGEMNLERIRIRKDLRTQTHLREIRAFDAEMTHWNNTELMLEPGETVSEAIRRGDDEAA